SEVAASAQATSRPVICAGAAVRSLRRAAFTATPARSHRIVVRPAQTQNPATNRIRNGEGDVPVGMYVPNVHGKAPYTRAAHNPRCAKYAHAASQVVAKPSHSAITRTRSRAKPSGPPSQRRRTTSQADTAAGSEIAVGLISVPAPHSAP